MEILAQDTLQPINEVRLIVNGVDILISHWQLEAVYPPYWFPDCTICGHKFSCQIHDMRELSLILEENSVIELVVLDKCFPALTFKVNRAPTSGEFIFSGEFKDKSK